MTGRRDVRAAMAEDRFYVFTHAVGISEVESWLARYVLEIWPLDQERGGPGDGCDPLRLQLWRIAKLNRGDALGWRQILRVLER